MVENGYEAIFGEAAVIAARRLDLPALGSPIMPTSPSNFSSNLIDFFSAFSPFSARRGYLLVEDEKFELPFPPFPPLAITKKSP